MASCIEYLQYHIVWSTKYRYRLLNSDIVEILKQYLLNKQSKWSYVVKSIAIEEDHVHLLVQVVLSQVDLNKLIARLKGGSSFLLRKKFRFLMSYPALWTPSHFVASVGNVSDKTIEAYLSKQGIEEKEVVSRTFKYKVISSKTKERKLKQYFKACLKGKKEKAPSSILQDFNLIKRKENEFGLYLRAQGLKLERRNTKKAKYWLRFSGSRYEKSFWLGLQGRDLPEDCKIYDSTIREKGGKFYVHLSIKQERMIKRVRIDKVIAIDLGINHPITSVMLYDGKVKNHHCYGKEIKNQIYKRSRRAAQLQHSEMKNVGEGIAKFTRRINEFVHLYTNEIVKQAKETDSSIVIGNLRGINEIWIKGKTGKKTRRKANKTPYGKIMSQLFYKGTLAAIPVVFVNEAYTSQRCSKCGLIKKTQRKGERYLCECGYQNQADVNGAINIGSVALANLLSQSHPALIHESANASL